MIFRKSCWLLPAVVLTLLPAITDEVEGARPQTDPIDAVLPGGFHGFAQGQTWRVIARVMPAHSPEYGLKIEAFDRTVVRAALTSVLDKPIMKQLRDLNSEWHSLDSEQTTHLVAQVRYSTIEADEKCPGLLSLVAEWEELRVPVFSEPRVITDGVFYSVWIEYSPVRTNWHYSELSSPSHPISKWIQEVIASIRECAKGPA